MRPIVVYNIKVITPTTLYTINIYHILIFNTELIYNGMIPVHFGSHKKINILV